MGKFDLKKQAMIAGVEYTERPNGHIQLRGPLLVNYYPFSKQRTAYVAGTKKAATGISPQQALAMCFEAPNCMGVIDDRTRNSRSKRKKMLQKITLCHWCKTPLTLDTSTIEHIIQLSRGGLDNANNRTLACRDCNHSRGSNMPELKQHKVTL